MVRRQGLQICQIWRNYFLLEIFQIWEFKEFLKRVILIYKYVNSSENRNVRLNFIISAAQNSFTLYNCTNSETIPNQKHYQSKYRKIPKISPGAYIFQRPFLRGLFLEGLIYGGKFAFQNRMGYPFIWE